MDHPRPSILVLCTHNSARSQMGEALFRHLSGGTVDVESAGSQPSRVHPLAIEAMARRGIDHAGGRSKHMDELMDRTFDYVITVCDHASETCPIFPGAPVRIHWSLPDPSAVTGSEEERLGAFLRVAEDLEARIGDFLERLPNAEA